MWWFDAAVYGLMAVGLGVWAWAMWGADWPRMGRGEPPPRRAETTMGVPSHFLEEKGNHRWAQIRTVLKATPGKDEA